MQTDNTNRQTEKKDTRDRQAKQATDGTISVGDNQNTEHVRTKLYTSFPNPLCGRPESRLAAPCVTVKNVSRSEIIRIADVNTAQAYVISEHEEQ